MRPLVRVRRATPFDPDFLARSSLLWPLEQAARRLGRGEGFPSRETLQRVFAGESPVRFVPSAPRGRRRVSVDPAALYDGRITLERSVPTRAGCWHDFMNALVWGTFPAAKRALHARQHRAIAARVEPGARVLPPTRTPELDALALLDEGGVVVMADDPGLMRATLRERNGALRAAVVAGSAEAIVFGHAIFESLVLGVSPAAVAAVVLERDVRAGDGSRLRAVDSALSAVLADASQLQSPGELCRVDLGDALPCSPQRATQMLPGLSSS
jgi:hypothetical protein